MSNEIKYFNGTFSKEVNLDNLNRGFSYGDGLFETIVYKNETIQYFEDHILRLKKGLKMLNINFDTSGLKHNILELISRNKLIKTDVRIKIIVYRNIGGFYSPTNTTSSVIITTETLLTPSNTIKSMGICNNVKLPKTMLGNLKTLSALPYVIASIEKSNCIHDELILMNTNYEICECTSSNIFWKKDDIYYTPSLETGCIDGIMRKKTIQGFIEKQIKIKEGLYTLKDIKTSDEIFTTNVIGIRTLESVNLIIE